MADFNAARRFDGLSAARTGIAGVDNSQVRERFDFEIPADIHVFQMAILPVASRDKIHHIDHRIIDKNRGFDIDGTGETARRPGDFPDHVVGGQFQFGRGEIIFNLDLVDLVISADQHGAGFAVGIEDQRFDDVLRRDFQEGTDFLDGADIRRIHVLQGQPVVFKDDFFLGTGHFGLFQIRRVGAFFAKHHRVFSGVGHDHELVGILAADASGIRFHRPELQTAAPENIVIRSKHFFVTFLGALFIDIKTVGVFHAELAAAHHAEPRTDFVAEFGLDLIQVERQLTVGFHVVAHQARNDFFMRRPQTIFMIMPVAESQKFLAVISPPPRFLPDFRRLNHGQMHFLRARPVHLLADDLLQFSDHPVPQRKVGIDAAGQFADQSRPDHQLVTDDFRIGRHFPDGR